MKNLIFVSILFLLGALTTKAFSQSVVDLTLAKTGDLVMTKTSFDKLWASKSLICIKHKSSYIGGNDAYNAVFAGKQRRANCVGSDTDTAIVNARVGNAVTKVSPKLVPMHILCQFVKGPACK